MKYCIKCGRENGDDNRFCPNCGKDQIAVNVTTKDRDMSYGRTAFLLITIITASIAFFGVVLALIFTFDVTDSEVITVLGKKIYFADANLVSDIATILITVTVLYIIAFFAFLGYCLSSMKK